MARLTQLTILVNVLLICGAARLPRQVQDSASETTDSYGTIPDYVYGTTSYYGYGTTPYYAYGTTPFYAYGTTPFYGYESTPYYDYGTTPYYSSWTTSYYGYGTTEGYRQEATEPPIEFGGNQNTVYCSPYREAYLDLSLSVYRVPTIIRSPNYGNGSYYNSETCSVTIRNQGVTTRLNLNVRDFDVERDSYCSYDWLCIKGVKFCGDWLTGSVYELVVPPNDTFTFQFHTDGSVVNRGFELFVTFESDDQANRTEIFSGVGSSPYSYSIHHAPLDSYEDTCKQGYNYGYETTPYYGYGTSPYYGYGTSPYYGYGTTPYYGYGTTPYYGYGTTPYYNYGTTPYYDYGTTPYYGYGTTPYYGYEINPNYGYGTTSSYGYGTTPYYNYGTTPYYGYGTTPYYGYGTTSYYGYGTTPYYGYGTTPYYGCGTTPYYNYGTTPYYGYGTTPYYGYGTTSYYGYGTTPYYNSWTTPYYSYGTTEGYGQGRTEPPIEFGGDQNTVYCNPDRETYLDLGLSGYKVPTIIRSPNFGNGPYYDSETCSVTIRTQGVPTRLHLRVQDFDVEKNDQCNYDWLCIKGVRFCGEWATNSSYELVVPSYDTFTLKFHTDGSVTRRGFELFVTFESDDQANETEIFYGVGSSPYSFAIHHAPLYSYEDTCRQGNYGYETTPYYGYGTSPYYGYGTTPYYGYGTTPYYGYGTTPYYGYGTTPYYGYGTTPYNPNVDQHLQNAQYEIEVARNLLRHMP